MASPEHPEDTLAATAPAAGGAAPRGLPTVPARVRVYRPRRYRARAFLYGFVVAALLVAAALMCWLR
ncbi:hypothetical protein SAMN04515671_2239 [Nakamurella panacisegetis]|uniref:Uncharacterized protein n=1 Tax=Nakamurella panacisegetis TaxID=1090615 RepID=A0A1H0N7E7_9ACTN|nr:hypothetical protein [Nakamurella panacisegetis]SDO88597.1 hypothetical protein SAMN04515671_2239 [Nakamurella panacisegetis]